MSLFDSHCHIDDSRFDPDRSAVLTRAQHANVLNIVVPATHAAGWQKQQDICQAHPQLHPAYGLHPQFSQHHQPQHLDQLEHWLDHHPAIAVGECGLDFYAGKADREQQLERLHAQFEIAHKTGLPIILHARKSLHDITLAIRDYPSVRGVIHSYSGSYEQAKILIERGYYLGIGGPFTWQRSRKLQALIKQLPSEALLLETDAPDQPDECHRGQRNEPAWLADIAASIALLRTQSIEELAAITHANACELFNVKP